ncbi:MAG TPA: DUF3667 domain-containing protein [Woeseiaceae bacterium]
MAAPPLCPNCGYPAPGNFCSHCGQKQAERRISVRYLIHDFLDEQFGINNRTARTLKLLIRPGRLTSEYFDGRIQQYIPPLKLYLIGSVLFFFVVAVAPDFELIEIGDVTTDAPADSAAVANAQPPADFFLWVPPGSDNWLRDIRVDFGVPAVSRAAERNLHDLSLFGPEEGTQRLASTIEAQIPTVLFLFLPLYALLLYLFFRKQRRYYVEHFVFALHLHAFIFIAFIPAILIRVTAVRAVILLGVFLYIYLALKHVYRQGWLVTAAKYLVLWFLYLIYFSIGMVAATMIALTT